MLKVRALLTIGAALILTGATTLALAQSAVEQTQPDNRQPETAVDKERGAPETAKDDQRLKPETARDDQRLEPETAKDDQKLKPETASDAPPQPSSAQQKLAEVAKQGVRSNTPPPAKPQG